MNPSNSQFGPALTHFTKNPTHGLRGPKEIPSDIVNTGTLVSHDRNKVSSSVTTVKGGMGKENFNRLSTEATEGFKSGSIAKYNQEGLKEHEKANPSKRETIKIDSSK